MPASEPNKKKKPLWKTNQRAHQTPPSLSLPLAPSLPLSPRKALVRARSPSHSSSLPRLRQEDGTAHSAPRTGTEGVAHRLAAGLLNSPPCPVTRGSRWCCCAWWLSGSAGGTEAGKSGGPRRRTLTSPAGGYRSNRRFTDVYQRGAFTHDSAPHAEC